MRVFSHNSGATLAEVADTAGVGRATLHRHFTSREHLLSELSQDALEQIERATAGIEATVTTATEAMERIFAAVIPLGPRLRFLQSEPPANATASDLVQWNRHVGVMREVVEGMKLEGTVAADMPTDWVVALVDALIWAAFTRVESGDIARNSAADLAFRTFARGVAPAPVARDSTGDQR